MKIKIIFLVLVMSLIASCGNKTKKEEPKTDNKNTYEQIKGINWFIGQWEADMNPGLFMETWTATNDSVYSGMGVGLGSGKDTTFTESISIVQRGKDVFYITVISDQNEGKPTEFKMTGSSATTAVFENKEHDFPQKIAYELKGDSLIATVSGLNKGKPAMEVFPLVKSK